MNDAGWNVAEAARDMERVAVAVRDMEQDLRCAAREGRVAETLGTAVKMLAEGGVTRAVLPVCEGGAGLARGPHAARPLCTILRRLGRIDLSLARLFEGHVNAIRLVEVHGTTRQRARCAELVRDGALLAVWGADGDPPVRLLTETMQLTGRKRFASGLGLVTHALLTARPEEGDPRLVLIDAGNAARHDPAAWRASAMRASASGGFDAEGLVVDAGDLVGAPGALMQEPHFEGGVWRYCAAHVGGAEALIGETRAALMASGRLEDPIQRSRLGGLYAAVDTARLVTEAAAEATEASVSAGPERIRLAVARALLARETVERCCVEALAVTERALGMAAFDSGCDLDRIRRDLSLFLRQARPDAKLEQAVEALTGEGAPEIGEAW